MYYLSKVTSRIFYVNLAWFLNLQKLSDQLCAEAVRVFPHLHDVSLWCKLRDKISTGIRKGKMSWFFGGVEIQWSLDFAWFFLNEWTWWWVKWFHNCSTYSREVSLVFPAAVIFFSWMLPKPGLWHMVLWYSGSWFKKESKLSNQSARENFTVVSYLEHKTNDWMWSKINFLVELQEPLLATVQSETCMVQACYMPWQPLQNHPSGHLAGCAMLWSADEKLNGQHQRVDISPHAWSAHKGLLQKRLQEGHCRIVSHVPLDDPTSQGTELNWLW